MLVQHSLTFIILQNTSTGASLFAGATAGAVEGLITYPAEFLKTSSQFARKAGADAKVR